MTSKPINEHTVWTMKEVCEFFKRSRAAIDRWRKRYGFPEPHWPSGKPGRGTMVFFAVQVIAWIQHR